ncbi:hypothetical protein [Glaciimonas sp. GG7]
MWLLILEATVAFFLFVFIVWWTMSGRKPDQMPPRKASPNKKKDNQST